MRRLAWSLCGILLLLSLSLAASDQGELIVTLKPGQNIETVNRANGTRTVAHIPHSSVYLVSVVDTEQPARVLKKIRLDSAVDSAEENVDIELTSSDQAMNVSANLGHALSDLLDGQTLTTFYGTTVLKAYADQPALQLTRIDAVRQVSTGAATRVAYIDTGVDSDHPALRAWLEPGTDLINGQSADELDGLGHAMSDLLDHAMSDLLDDRFSFLLNGAGGNDSPFPPAFGHGTMVAGLIHVAAPEARIYPIKAFDAYGLTSMFQVIRGVYAAIDASADVLNMSFSTAEDSEAFRKALIQAHSAGVTLVAAVGNEGRDVHNLYPAAYDNVYGIAATDLDDRIASFSNYGKSVSVTAPGAMVVSTAPGGRYAAAWGTSFSSPIVAGSMALLASSRAYGKSDASRVVTTADSIDARNPGFEKKLGKGRINLEQALKVKQ